MFIGKTTGVNCGQMIEVCPKTEKDKPCQMYLSLIKIMPHEFWAECVLC